MRGKKPPTSHNDSLVGLEAGGVKSDKKKPPTSRNDSLVGLGAGIVV